MLFNSISFLVFFPSFFILYWFVFSKSLKAQNVFILISSYIFYGWWDWRFLTLIAFSTLLDYFVGLKIDSNVRGKRKFYLWLSIIINIGLLAFFKYFNFFTESWIDACLGLGFVVNPFVINVLLPVGISFYTFQTMSYSIDIYRDNLKPTKDFVAFAAFVSFFPQLVAGPIERASNLLPQILRQRSFNFEMAKSGLNRIIYGFFKKMVIADNLSMYVNDVFSMQPDSPFLLVLGAIAFGIQIYCDFSGYSDIAIGTARLLGFDLMINFNFPYFSKNITDFWRRWHISLSTWFRDYIYVPLGGSRGSLFLKIRNTFIVFFVSGFWHGANWTFIIWGLIHALVFLPSLIFRSRRIENMKNVILRSLFNLISGLITFSIVTLAWVFFRADTVNSAFSYLNQIFYGDSSWQKVLDFRISATEGSVLEVFALLILFLMLELWTKFRNYNFNLVESALIALVLIFMGNFYHPSSFIYFQF